MPGRRVSTSAIKIARVVAFIGQHPELKPLLPEGAFEETVRILAAAGKLKPWMLRLFRAPWFDSYYRWLERHTMPTEFLRTMHRCTAAGSTLVLSHMRVDAAGEFQLGMAPWLTKLALRITREPLGWGVRDGELGSFLQAHGFHLKSAPEREELRLRYLEPAGLGDRVPGIVELLAVAESQ